MNTSIHQLGNADLLTNAEPTLQDQLADLARRRGTQVHAVGDQLSLLDSGAVPMVEVTHGKTRLLVSAEMAARFGLYARE